MYSIKTLPPDRWALLDQHAVNCPQKSKQSVKHLSDYLFQPTQNDVEKIWVIFRWTTHHIHYDTKAAFKRNASLPDVNSILKKGSAVCGGYAEVILKLTLAAGIDCRTVAGYSKGYEYSVGEKLSDSGNHAWNAVKLNGSWQLIDGTWGAGFLDDNKQFHQYFNQYYFLTPPDQFIYSHLPEDPKWQLLKNPISRYRFENLVPLKPAFFACGLEIDNYSNGVIKTKNSCVIKFKGLRDSILSSVLMSGGRKLDDTYTFIRRKDKKHLILVILPQPGEYTLRLFAKLRNDTLKYDWALDYKIVSSMGSKALDRFVKAFDAFHENNGFLYKPLAGYLKSGVEQSFKLRLENAKRVAIKNNAKWSFLTKRRSHYEGRMTPEKGSLEIYADFLGNEQFSGLLQYSIL